MDRQRWIVIGFLLSGGIINYMDRAVFGLLAPSMRADLGLNAAELGLALSAFSVGYTLFTVIGGWAADRFGPRRVILLAMTLWSSLCALTGMVGNLWALIGVRFVFGAAEGPWMASGNAVLAQWFSRERFATAYGACATGQPLGGVVGGPIVGFAAYAFGWRGGFIAVGVIGLIWAALWLAFAKDGPGDGADPLHAPAPSQLDAPAAAGPADPTAFAIFMQPTVAATAVCMACAGYLLTFFLSWFPSFLTVSFGLNVAQLGLITTIPWLVGAVTFVLGGFVVDAIGAAIGNPLRARKIILVTCLTLAAAAMILVPEQKTLTGAIATMALAVGFVYSAASTYFAIAITVTPRQSFGFVTGMMLFVSSLASACAPAISGFLIQATGSYTTAFLVAGGVMMAGVLGVLLFVRPPGASQRRPEPAAQPSK